MHPPIRRDVREMHKLMEIRVLELNCSTLECSVFFRFASVLHVLFLSFRLSFPSTIPCYFCFVLSSFFLSFLINSLLVSLFLPFCLHFCLYFSVPSILPYLLPFLFDPHVFVFALCTYFLLRFLFNLFVISVCLFALPFFWRV